MEKNKIDALLDAVDDIINHASWYPETEFATEEMIISTRYVNKLRKAYEDYESTPNNALAADFEKGAV